MSEAFVSRVMTSMTDAILLDLGRTIRFLKDAHPDDPASVVAGIESWATEQAEKNDARWNAPVMGNFHRVISPEGTLIRDWWPTPKDETLKAWLRGNAPAGSTVEHKTDIAREGDKRWFRGKGSGDAPDRG